ncbi:MAG: hypothetical protein AAGE88_18290 [Actinomycetota bacterium]
MQTDYDCVMERRASHSMIDRSIWHIAKHRGRTVDFVPIRCGTSPYDGIVLPSHIIRREPTCADCRRIVGLSDKARETRTTKED